MDLAVLLRFGDDGLSLSPGVIDGGGVSTKVQEVALLIGKPPSVRTFKGASE